jgi:hypothetical protein
VMAELRGVRACDHRREWTDVVHRKLRQQSWFLSVL